MMRTQNIPLSISKNKFPYIIPNLHLWDPRTQEQVLNSHGKQTISVRATAMDQI